MFCPHCGVLQSDDMQTCHACGRPLTGESADQHCPTCGAPTIADAQYCAICGAALPARALAEQDTPLTLESLPAWLRSEEPGELEAASTLSPPAPSSQGTSNDVSFSLLDESDLPEWLRELAETESPPSPAEHFAEMPVLPPPSVQRAWDTVAAPSITGVALAAFEPLPADLLALEPVEPPPAPPTPPPSPPSSSRALRIILLLVALAIVLALVGYIFLLMQQS